MYRSSVALVYCGSRLAACNEGCTPCTIGTTVMTIAISNTMWYPGRVHYWCRQCLSIGYVPSSLWAAMNGRRSIDGSIYRQVDTSYRLVACTIYSGGKSLSWLSTDRRGCVLHYCSHCCVLIPTGPFYSLLWLAMTMTLFTDENLVHSRTLQRKYRILLL